MKYRADLVCRETSRCRSQDYPSIPICQLQHQRIVELNRMLFAVDVDDEISRRGPFWRDRFHDRSRLTGLGNIDSASHQIRSDDAPALWRATQAQTRGIDLG